MNHFFFFVFKNVFIFLFQCKYLPILQNKNVENKSFKKLTFIGLDFKENVLVLIMIMKNEEKIHKHIYMIFLVKKS